MGDEKVAYATRSEQCEHDERMMETDTVETKSAIEKLAAAIGTQEGIVASKGAEIATQTQISTDAQGASKENDADRAADRKEYKAQKFDLEDAIVALDEAKRILAREADRQKEFGKKGEDAVAFLQSSGASPNVKTMVAALLETKGMKEAAAYESNMGMVIELLDDEQRDVRKQLNEVEIAEINQKNAYTKLKQDYQNQVDAAERTKAEAQAAMQTAASEKAEAEERKASEEADLAATQKNLAAWQKLCKEEGLSYDEKQAVRKDEIEAIKQALEILEGVAANKLIQTSKSLLQVTQKGNGVDARAESAKVSLFLAHRGTDMKSQVLSLLAEKIADDPFSKVKDMIEAMIDKLVKEGGQEQEKKIYCDTEIKKNKKALQRANLEFERATAEEEKQSAMHVRLTEEEKLLREEVVDLKKAMAEADALREAEKQRNLHEIEVCTEDADGVTQALNVLREFYSKMGGVTAFLQKGIKYGSLEWNELDDPNKPVDFVYGQAGKGQRDTGHTNGMATFGDSYGGQADTANAVLAMLETVVESVNEKKVGIQQAESEAASAHDEFKKDSKIAVVQKATTADNNQTNAADAKMKRNQAKGSRTAQERQLGAIQSAKEALLPTCPVWAGGTGGTVSHETRQLQRQDEIDALKDALEMLKQ